MRLIRPGQGGNRAIASLLAVWLALLPAARVRADARPPSLEYAVQATYLLKFPAFVTWNEPLPANVFTICVVGHNPFSGLLRQAAAGQTIERRRVAVRVLSFASRSSGCQMMYVAGSRAQPVASALATVRGTPVLTVTDGQRDAAAKGIINFIVAEERVRFEIDPAAARANGLTISSKLLILARNLRGRTGR